MEENQTDSGQGTLDRWMDFLCLLFIPCQFWTNSASFIKIYLFCDRYCTNIEQISQILSPSPKGHKNQNFTLQEFQMDDKSSGHHQWSASSVQWNQVNIPLLNYPWPKDWFTLSTIYYINLSVNDLCRTQRKVQVTSL